jgi:hypothetical protein
MPTLTKTMRASLVLFLWMSEAMYGRACGPPPSVCRAYELTSDVFVGRILSVENPSLESTTGPPGYGGAHGSRKPTKIRVRIERVFRGRLNGDFEFSQGRTDCSIDFVPNERYLIYGVFKNGEFLTSKCTRTRVFSKATADLEYLSVMHQEGALASVSGTVWKVLFDKDGKWQGEQTPFSQYEVVADGENGRFRTVSEPSGVFDLALPPGKYHLWAEKEGKIVGKSTDVMTVGKGECRSTAIDVRIDAVPSAR